MNFEKKIISSLIFISASLTSMDWQNLITDAPKTSYVLKSISQEIPIVGPDTKAKKFVKNHIKDYTGRRRPKKPVPLEFTQSTGKMPNFIPNKKKRKNNGSIASSSSSPTPISQPGSHLIAKHHSCMLGLQNELQAKFFLNPTNDDHVPYHPRINVKIKKELPEFLCNFKECTFFSNDLYQLVWHRCTHFLKERKAINVQMVKYVCQNLIKTDSWLFPSPALNCLLFKTRTQNLILAPFPQKIDNPAQKSEIEQQNISKSFEDLIKEIELQSSNPESILEKVTIKKEIDPLPPLLSNIALDKIDDEELISILQNYYKDDRQATNK